MPKRRPPKELEKALSKEDIEKFAKQSDDAIGDASILNPDAEPAIGLNIRFNSYEHQRLRQLAKKEGRSMQKQIKMILRKELGV
jgi:hypothetical protein